MRKFECHYGEVRHRFHRFLLKFGRIPELGNMCHPLRLSPMMSQGRFKPRRCEIEHIPLVSKEAKNPSCPDAKASMTLGKPPSEPTLSMLYLSRFGQTCW